MRPDQPSPPDRVSSGEGEPVRPPPPPDTVVVTAAHAQPEGGLIHIPFARPVQTDNAGWPALPYARPATLAAEPKPLPWWLALIEAILLVPAVLLGVIIAGPYVLAWNLADERWATVILTAAGGVTAMLACLGMLRLEGSPAATIGWTSRNLALDTSLGLAGYVLTYAALIVLAIWLSILFPQIAEHQDDAAKAIKSTFPDMSLAQAALFMLFVAVWEEFAFRGFLLTRLYMVFKRWWLAVPVGAVIFGFGHGYQGPIAMVQTTLLGLVLGALFVWRKSLVPVIVFHFLNNFVAFLLVRMMPT